MRSKRIDLSAQLATVPVRNRSVRLLHENDGDDIVVEVDLHFSRWARPLAQIFGARKRKRYQLDQVGREIYALVDGQRSFEQLVDAFSEHHALTFFESRALLMQYMAILMKRGLVVIGVQTEARMEERAG